MTTRPGRSDATAVGWWVLVGTGSGALAGILVGGLGGRLAMLVLRLTSPDEVLGVTSDDGFEIGVVSADTIDLLVVTAAIGALNGIAYAALRDAIPGRLRLPLWTLLSATLVGTMVLHADGVDFTLLEPAVLAVVLFVVLPAAAAALVVVLVGRWVSLDPGEHRRLLSLLVVASLAALPALVVAGLVWLGALGVRRAGAGAAALRRAARVAVPAGIGAVTAIAAVGLVRDVAAIL